LLGVEFGHGGVIPVAFPPALQATSPSDGEEGDATGAGIKGRCGRKASASAVLFLDVGQDDLHRVGRAAERAAGALGQLLGKLAALLDGAAFEHLDVDHRHGFLPLQFLWSMET
jgi:hypothetical protein